MKYKQIAIFASGNGSNAENIINYFKNRDICFTIFCNNKKAFVIERAKNMNIPIVLLSKEDIENGKLQEALTENKIEFIVLAGFLLKVPLGVIENYDKRIINIHPALLPKYGGKGMYGINVHNTIFHNKEKETGITIHYVNENYDEGGIIFQEKIDIQNISSAEEIARRVHDLEYKYFPLVLDKIFSN